MSRLVAESAPELLARLYPPLQRYWPNLSSVSAKQAAFLLLDQLEAFYGGAAGGGKSDALLAAALQYVDTPGYAALILRRTFRQLDMPDAIMARSKEWLTQTDATWNDDAKRWTFPSGATLTFGYLEHDNDVYNYQGPAFQFVGWDELTQFPEKQYVYLFSRTRRRKDLRELGIPIRHRSASNPGGVGHAWVKGRFIDPDTRAPDAVFIPAKVDDNPGLDVEEYRESLARLDETLRQQLLDGDWGVFEGAAFAAFRDDLHLVPVFRPPAEWIRFESLDHGVANPTCCLVWAVDFDGNLITFDSYYSPGLVSEHAAALLKRRGAAGVPGWWPRDQGGWLAQTPVAYADPSMWARTGHRTRMGDAASVATEYLELGVTGLTGANNDRKAGRVRLLELLKPDEERPFPDWHPRAGETGSPRWFIVGDRCVELVDQLHAAPVNPDPVGQKIGAGEIVDPKWESAYGHAVAAARYGAMSWQQAMPPVRPRERSADPRQAAVQDMNERELEADEELDALGVSVQTL